MKFTLTVNHKLNVPPPIILVGGCKWWSDFRPVARFEPTLWSIAQGRVTAVDPAVMSLR